MAEAHVYRQFSQTEGRPILHPRRAQANPCPAKGRGSGQQLHLTQPSCSRAEAPAQISRTMCQGWICTLDPLGAVEATPAPVKPAPYLLFSHKKGIPFTPLAITLL